MEFLDTNEYINKVKRKQLELETIYDNLLSVGKILKNENLTPDDFEYLYAREFKLIIELSGAYNDLEKLLDKLYNEVPEQRFFANRVKSEIDLYKIWETIEI